MSANGEAQVDSWEEVESLPIDRLRLEPPAPRQQQDSAYEQGQAPETNTSIPGEAAASSPPGVPGVDPAVYDALCNSRSRLQVLRLEQEVEGFLASGEPELHFPLTLSAYQRLLAHRVAQFHGLETRAVEEAGEHCGKVAAVRGQPFRPAPFQLASVRLPDSGTAAESASTAEAPRVLKKRDSEPRLIALEKDDAAAMGAAGPDMRSVEEREQDYNRARERILGGSDSSERLDDCATRRSSSRGASARNSEDAMDAPAAGGRKAVFRNREEELRDPDFQRATSRYQQRLVPGYGEGDPYNGVSYQPRTYHNEFPALGLDPSYAFSMPGSMPLPRMAGTINGTHMVNYAPDLGYCADYAAPPQPPGGYPMMSHPATGFMSPPPQVMFAAHQQMAYGGAPSFGYLHQGAGGHALPMAPPRGMHSNMGAGLAHMHSGPLQMTQQAAMQQHAAAMGMIPPPSIPRRQSLSRLPSGGLANSQQPRDRPL